MHLCIYVLMYECMHVCMYVCMHVCIYVCMFVCLNVLFLINVSMFVFFRFVGMYVCRYVDMSCLRTLELHVFDRSLRTWTYINKFLSSLYDANCWLSAPMRNKHCWKKTTFSSIVARSSVHSNGNSHWQGCLPFSYGPSDCYTWNYNSYI